MVTTVKERAEEQIMKHRKFQDVVVIWNSVGYIVKAVVWTIFYISKVILENHIYEVHTFRIRHVYLHLEFKNVSKHSEVFLVF